MTLHADALARADRVAAARRPSRRPLRDRYVAHLARHADGMTRGCHPDHLTASTLVLSADLDRVLLTLHAKAGQWFQFGGHCEPGDRTLAGRRAREAAEESGHRRARRSTRCRSSSSEHAVPFCDPRGGVHHLDVRFVGRGSRRRRARGQRGVARRALVAGRRAADPEPDLVELVALARARSASTVSRRRRSPAATRAGRPPTSPAR